jgi:hypothetical protein
MISKYILLRVKEELPNEIVKSWVEIVINEAPPGVATTLQIYNDSGTPHDIRMVKRVKEDKSIEYLVPLSRDLTSKEIAKIVTCFADKHKDLDFDVETNETQLVLNNVAKLDPKGFESLGLELAKQEHSDWLKDRTNAGWSYGITFSTNKKTNPLLLPWEQLPDKMKQPKNNLPQKVVDFLNQQGYAIISKDKLSKIMKLIS